jgi:hypothetical protein
MVILMALLSYSQKTTPQWTITLPQRHPCPTVVPIPQTQTPIPHDDVIRNERRMFFTMYLTNPCSMQSKSSTSPTQTDATNGPFSLRREESSFNCKRKTREHKAQISTPRGDVCQDAVAVLPAITIELTSLQHKRLAAKQENVWSLSGL